MTQKPVLTLSALAATLVLSTSAFGAAWQVVDSNSSVQTEVDLASAARKDGQVTGWVQHTYTRKTATQSGAYFSFRTMKEQVKLHCADQTMTVLVRGYFDDEGSEIALIKGTGETRNVLPETREQRVLARLCNPTTDVGRAPRGRAATQPVEARYMDGPAPRPMKDGIVRAAASGHDAPAAAGIVKPMDKPLIKPEDKAAGKAEEKAAKAEEKPAAKADDKHGAPADKAAAKPADDKHAKPADKAAEAPKAAAKTGHGAEAPQGKPVREVTNPHEREAMIARAKEKVGAPAPVTRPRGIQVAALSPKAAGHGASAHGAAAPAGSAHGHEAHWSYEGEFAPYRWGDMKTEYAACKSGTRQSPIDIRNPVIGEVEPIRFNYEPSALKVTNNGHTIQVDYAPGSHIRFGGARYELVQFHFHTPSEERINGRAFDMVAHLVHKNAQGRLAVVAVLLTAGAEQKTIQTIWNAMPGLPSATRERLDVTINAADLLPADQTYYSFMGSLTTPPCTEGVQWLVMKNPVEISRDQISHFTALYPMNARPLQAQNDRLIKVGR